MLPTDGQIPDRQTVAKCCREREREKEKQTFWATVDGTRTERNENELDDSKILTWWWLQTRKKW